MVVSCAEGQALYLWGPPVRRTRILCRLALRAETTPARRMIARVLSTRTCQYEIDYMACEMRTSRSRIDLAFCDSRLEVLAIPPSAPLLVPDRFFCLIEPRYWRKQRFWTI